MTMYILATTRTNHEFATADAINAMGALAVVPRKVQHIPAQNGKRASYDYRPFMPQYIFLAMTEAQWHEIHSRPMYWDKPVGKTKDGQIITKRIILDPPRRALDILPRTWADFQAFAHRAELACDRRIEQIERGDAVARYRRGDKLRILGDMTQGQLRAEVATFLRLDAKGRIVAESVGVEVFGKPFTMTLDAVQVEAIAAE
jgi:transcription antitermination factor NusG